MDGFASAPSGLDLREAAHLEFARRTAEGFLADCPSLENLDRLEADLIVRQFAFDVGLLIKTELQRAVHVEEVLGWSVVTHPSSCYYA